MMKFVYFASALFLFFLLSDAKSASQSVKPKEDNTLHSFSATQESNANILLSSKRDYHFTDPRMKANQNTYEETIMEMILNDLKNTPNVTEIETKYPQNSSITILIDEKYAYHVLIDTDAIELYVYKFDLELQNCGAIPKNLQIIHKTEIKGNIFELRSIPNKKYRVIIEQLLTDSKSFVSNIDQEIPLFITIHPALTFLPAVIIEDTLENIRVDFKALNSRCCVDCPNIISFDEYAHLTWFINEEQEGFDKILGAENRILNIGFHPKAIFISYPLEIASQSDEDDKIVKHSTCKNSVITQDSFVQNAYFEKSPEKVGSDLLYQFVKQATERANPNSKVEINYPCYPKYYVEKLENMAIKGSGNLKECKNEIRSFIKRNNIRSETPQSFGIPNYRLPWPLERIKDTGLLKDSTIYIESHLLTSLFKSYQIQDNYKSITKKDLSKEVEEFCTGFLAQEIDINLGGKDKKDNLGKCVYLIYSLTLLEQAGIEDTKQIRLKAGDVINQIWITGLTTRNIETFYDHEYQWFLQTQQRIVERYINLIKEQTQQDKRHALNVTFGVIIFLMILFWIAFIVRYRKVEEIESKENQKKK